MRDTNSLRRLNWLWKNRHTHDANSEGESTRQTIIEVINEEKPPGTGASTGAYIHLERASTQSIPSGTATAVAWDTSGYFTPRNFAVPALPSSQVTIQEPGYYDVHVGLLLASSVGSPACSITLTRNGSEQTVWPMSSDPSIWSADYTTDRFSGTGKGIPLLPSDIIQVYVEQSSGSAVNLSKAVIAVELVDRVPTPSTGATVTSASYSDAGPLSTHPVNLPDSVTGDLLIVGVSTEPSVSISFPVGWTTLGSESIGGKLETKWAYKVADGTEGSTVDATLGSSTWAFGHSVVVVGDTAWATPDINTRSDSYADGGDPGSGQPPAVTVSSSGNHLVFVSYMSRNIWGLSGPDGWDGLEVFDFIGGGHPELAALLSSARFFVFSSLTPGVIDHTNFDANVRGATYATIAVKLED